MRTSRLATQGSVYLIARAVQLVVFVAVMPLVTRQLDPLEYGVVAVALVVFQAVGAFAPVGITSVVAWSIYEHEDDAERTAQRLLIATGGLAVAVALLVHVTGPLWSGAFADLGYGGPLQLAVWMAVPVTVQACAMTIFQAQQRPGAFVACAIVGSAGGQVLGLAALATHSTATAYLAGVTLGAAAGALLALVLLPLRTLRPAPWSRVAAAVRHGGPTVAHLLGFMVLALADRLLIERMIGLESAARYQVAYVVGSAGSVLLYGLNNAWAPMVYADEDDGRWSTLTTTAVPLARLVGFVVAAVALTAPIGLRILAPASYGTNELTDVAVIVAASTLFDFVYLAAVHVLFKRKRTAVLLVAMPAAATLNVVLNLLLLEAWGLRGAAVATLAGYGLLALITARASRRVAAVPWPFPLAVVPLAVAATGILLGLLLPGAGIHLAVRLALTALLAIPLIASRPARTPELVTS
jgi:O-antigen/teichoic acid export membrane protein